MKFKFRTPDYDLDPKKGKYWTTKNVSFPLPNSNEPFNVGRKFAFNDMDEGIRDVTSFLKHFRENKVTFEFQHGISNYESLRKYLEDLQISKNVVALNKVFQSNFNYASTSSPIAGGGGNEDWRDLSEGEKERIQQWLQEIYDKKLLNERQVIRYARKALKNKKISIKYRIGKEAEYTKEMKELSANWAKRKQVDEFAVRTNLERHQKTVERTEESEIKFVQVAIFCDKLVIGHSLAVHITDLSSDVGRATHRIFHSSEIAEELHANPALMLINIYLSNIQNTVCFDFGISHLESEIIDFSNLRKALNGYTYFKSHFSSDISKPIVLLIFRNVYLKKMYLFRWGDRWYFEEPAEILSISRSIVRKTLRLLDKGQRNFGHFIIRKYLRNGKPVILSLRLDNNLFLKYSPIPLLEVVRLVPLVYKFRKSHIIIDLGSGDGTLLKILSKVGFQELIGIEIQVELYRHSVEHLESACEEKIKFINKNVLDFELEPSKKPILFTFFNSFQSELLRDWLLQQSNHIPKNSLLLSINDLTGGTLGPKIVLKSDRRFLFGHRIGIFSISPFTLYEL